MTSPPPPPVPGGEPAQPLVVREPTVAIIPTQYRPPEHGGYSAYPAPSYTPPPNYYQPVVPAQYQYPSQYPRPVYLPPPRRRRRGLAAAAVLALLVVLGIGGGAAVAVATGSDGLARSLGGPGPAGAKADARDGALVEVLNRRAKAVKDRDKAAFVADIDKSDTSFVASQETIYENLIKLPFAEFSYKLGDSVGFDDSIPTELKSKYGGQVRAPGVSVIHRIEDIDPNPVAAPWVPIFAQVSAKWLLVGEAKGKDLPSGVGGQPWDGGPILVERSESKRVVGVFAASNRTLAHQLVEIADLALEQVAVVRPGQWVGKVFMTAVRDRKVFDAYFGATPERVDQVAAIAVPHYNDVPDWNSQATYSATRVIFNPDEIDEDTDQLGTDMSHEFTHAAMAPVTTGWTPTWLVEGFAEYVSYKNIQINAESLKRALKDATTENLEAGEKFYEEPLNYLTGWLACRMISETYGEAKLIQFYEKFQSTSNEDVVVKEVLGIPRETLIKNWQAYVAEQRR